MRSWEDRKLRLRKALNPHRDRIAGLGDGLDAFLSAGEGGAASFVERMGSTLLDPEPYPPPPSERPLGRVLVGAGFAATLRFACLPPQDREDTIVIAARGEPWTERGQLRMGQSAKDLACETLPIDVVDLTPASDLDAFCPAITFGVSLRLSQLALGMEVRGATVESVRRDGDEFELGLRDGPSLRAEQLELATGVGPPRRMRAYADWDAMREAKTALFAEEDLREQSPLRGRIVIGSTGLTAAWVAEKALRDGCTGVWLLDSSHVRWPKNAARAAEEAKRQLCGLRSTERTRALLSKLRDFDEASRGAHLDGIDGEGCAMGKFVSYSYRRIVKSDAGVILHLDNGEQLEADVFVSALGQDDGWESGDPSEFDEPPAGTLLMDNWWLTPARNGAPVGVNDADERCRIVGAAGTRANEGVEPPQRPRCRPASAFVRWLIKRQQCPPSANSRDAVPYQGLAIRAHHSDPRGLLAPDGLALANLGTFRALSRVLEEEHARQVLETRERLDRLAMPADADVPEDFTESVDDGSLPPGWWTLEDFGLAAEIAECLASLESD